MQYKLERMPQYYPLYSFESPGLYSVSLLIQEWLVQNSQVCGTESLIEDYSTKQTLKFCCVPASRKL